MKKFKIIIFMLIILVCGLYSTHSDASQISNNHCYNNSDIESLPHLDLPQKEKWRRWRTRFFIVTQGAPYHMAHDLVVTPDTTAVMTGKFDYGSIFHKDLEFENIHVYIFGGKLENWRYLGKHITNSDGKIFVDIPQMDSGEYIIKMIVAGDLSETNGYMTVVEQGQKAVVFDIDGTLTLNDFEAVGDYFNVSTAKEYSYSIDTVNLYIARGYLAIFLTARPYWVSKESREWYGNKNLPIYTITHFTMNNKTWINPGDYKTEYMSYLTNKVGLDIVGAYGNSETDFLAYLAADIPHDKIYGIGKNAGEYGSTPLYDDYEDHFDDLIDELECAN